MKNSIFKENRSLKMSFDSLDRAYEQIDAAKQTVQLMESGEYQQQLQQAQTEFEDTLKNSLAKNGLQIDNKFTAQATTEFKINDSDGNSVGRIRQNFDTQSYTLTSADGSQILAEGKHITDILRKLSSNPNTAKQVLKDFAKRNNLGQVSFREGAFKINDREGYQLTLGDKNGNIRIIIRFTNGKFTGIKRDGSRETPFRDENESFGDLQQLLVTYASDITRQIDS